MSRKILAKHRRETLSGVSGKVLEVGFGTGLNLSFYPEGMQGLVAVEPNPGMNLIARKRIRDFPFPIQTLALDARKLPITDHTFDCAVSTWTLCSIPQVEEALGEIYRVLKPGGRFFFLEHGLSRDPRVQVWQHRLNSIHKKIASGCHLNRDMKKLIEEGRFEILKIDEFYMEQAPRILGYTYKGVAAKGGGHVTS